MRQQNNAHLACKLCGVWHQHKHFSAHTCYNDPSFLLLFLTCHAASLPAVQSTAPVAALPEAQRPCTRSHETVSPLSATCHAALGLLASHVQWCAGLSAPALTAASVCAALLALVAADASCHPAASNKTLMADKSISTPISGAGLSGSQEQV